MLVEDFFEMCSWLGTFFYFCLTYFLTGLMTDLLQIYKLVEHPESESYS